MDVFATSLTNAWLEAVARVQSAHAQQPKPVPTVNTLTDVIERALRGADPPRKSQDLSLSPHAIDRLA
jgi:hypothetical protein